jgi:hypothetical protein
MSFLKKDTRRGVFLLLSIVVLALSILVFTYNRSQPASGVMQGKVQQMKPGKRSQIAPNRRHP